MTGRSCCHPQSHEVSTPLLTRPRVQMQGPRPGKRRQRVRGGTREMYVRVFGLVGLALVYFVSQALGAAAPDLEAQVREITLQLRCPVCQGLSVADSPSELANEMRSLVREQLQQGKTPAEVLDYFVQRYGEWILLAPPKHGFNLVIWLLPFVLLPIGAVVIYLGARRWVRHPGAGESSPPRLDSPYAERLQRELDSYQ
jgi:cytochrome c-type biogenesis protein CcmH